MGAAYASALRVGDDGRGVEGWIGELGNVFLVADISVVAGEGENERGWYVGLVAFRDVEAVVTWVSAALEGFFDTGACGDARRERGAAT